jgi:hypothetical protein
VLSKSETSTTSGLLPREKAFYFFTSIGNYSGESAASLKEFVEAILKIDVKSLEFHLYRGDFEKWIAGTLEDRSLASKIRQLRELMPIGIDLRDRLYLIVSKHYENLKKRPVTSISSSKPRTTTITFVKPGASKTAEGQVK